MVYLPTALMPHITRRKLMVLYFEALPDKYGVDIHTPRIVVTVVESFIRVFAV